jgi:4-alpha-glucanotransferase
LDVTVTELPHELVELADLLGVATDYWDWQGQHVDVPRETIEAVLTALGIDTSTDEAVAAALEERRLRPWRRMLAPCTVTRSGRPYDIRVHVAHGAEVRAWVHLEDGARVELDRRDVWVDPIVVDGREVGAATFVVPGDLPLGWHRVHAQSDGSRPTGALVVTPGYLGIPPSVDARQVWGLHDPALQRALPPLVGARRPRRPGRARLVERSRARCGDSSSSTRCTRPSRSRRWSPRPTCR